MSPATPSDPIAAEEARLRDELAREPRRAETLWRLGGVLLKRGALREAGVRLRAAVSAAPAVARYHSDYGRALQKLGETTAALAAHAIAVRLAPGDAELWYRQGLAQQSAGRLAAAEASLRRAIEGGGGDGGALESLAHVLFEGGRLEEAVAVLRAQLARGRASRLAHDMLLFYLHFLPQSTRASLHAEHAAWAAAQVAPSWGQAGFHANDRRSERRLRIGYMSPDFREHPMAFCVWPLLAAHDREQFEVVLYSGVNQPDATTRRFRAMADAWRETTTWSDEQLAAAIREDRVDILVDLSSHMTRHRLLVFARKPAPVQVTWIGYPGTTGLAAIDYRLTDRFLDPPERGQAWYAEESVWLPDSYWCFDPMVGEIDVGPLPAGARGPVTFGCLNKCSKVNAPTIALWARVLRAVPDSRMIVRAANEVSRERIAAEFRVHGIEGARLELAGWLARADYLALHRRIDVALDPIPYGGHITLLDGLWMGVPAIALPGETAVARAGMSLLMTAGLPEWVAESEEDFVRIAVGQTRDRNRLAALRAGLRGRLRSSPLMDGPRFARGVEEAYRAMWRRWCETARP